MPRPLIDLTGKRFGRLVIIGKEKKPKRTMWICKCDCGKETSVQNGNLANGHTSSCGCLRVEIASTGKKAIKHGHCRDKKLTREYISYRAAWQRCYDPNSVSWKNYGARGITICFHWKNSFETFLKDMGSRPEGTCIERKDNYVGYFCPECCPPLGNCCWVTMSDQIKNQRHAEFHEERSERRTDWWMSQTKEYRHKRAVAAAIARWSK